MTALLPLERVPVKKEDVQPGLRVVVAFGGSQFAGMTGAVLDKERGSDGYWRVALEGIEAPQRFSWRALERAA
jgi:hypothetical protein